MEKGLIVISDTDLVAVALDDLKCGETYKANGADVTLVSDIPFGHKVALSDIKNGDTVIKYGHAIGHAIADIKKGEHVHAHNLKTNLSGEIDYTYNRNEAVFDDFKEKKEAYFDGYKRADGKVGIRNEVWIIPTVGCVNRTATILQNMAREKWGADVDGIFAYTHNVGCSQLGDDHRTTQNILKGLINNPNAGSVLVLSLGCENNNLDEFKPVLGEIDENRIKFLVTQDVEDEYEAGMDLLEQLVAHAKTFKREKVSASNLVIGFKCGGSDAFSGITANALCGRVTNEIVKCGGSAILTEVPEMFGAETLLMDRAVDEETFAETVELINNFKGYFTKYKQTIYENPSPGNKKGGISTLEEKSLGCTQKGGNAPVVGVLKYGEHISKNGLNLLIGPGNDTVSCTNLVASGAQIVLFTTGRGNPLGAPVPTVKIASNTKLFNRKNHWLDYNAGEILDGKSFKTVTDEMFNYLLDVASGKTKTKNEINEYKEISMFRDGVIL